MTWRQLPTPTDDEQEMVRACRPGRLYADEGFDEQIVLVLRELGVDITTVEGLGHQRRSQPERYRYTKAAERFLLTYDGTDLWTDDSAGWDDLYGLLVLDVDLKDDEDVATALKFLLQEVIPFSDLWVGHKVWLSSTEVKAKIRDQTGQVVTLDIRPDGDHAYVWYNGRPAGIWQG